MDTEVNRYLPIPINEFIQGVIVPVDLFIRLGDEKFIMVSRAGSTSDVAQFRKFQNREVEYVYVERKEYYKLTHQSITIAGIALSKREFDDSKRATLISSAARSIFRQLDSVGLDLEIYGHAKQITEAVIGLAEAHSNLAALFNSLAKFPDQIVAHSVAVSSISTLIAEGMGFQKRATLEKIALGGLLHDIGMKALPLALISKPIASMTAEELQIYETHPYKGAQMLISLGVVPDDVVSIVYEHHENSIGQGFPQRLRDVKMHPLARVVALADAYATLIIANPNCPVPKNPREALMYIEHTLGIPFNRDAFRALKKIIEKDQKAA
jgi:putative nucleotidyltransferase with HDIG domain